MSEFHGVTVSVEKKRGCGYRSPGGYYLVGPVLRHPCQLLPHVLEPCSTCKHDPYEPVRGLREVRSTILPAPSKVDASAECPVCFFALADADQDQATAYLDWIGVESYPTAAPFLEEAGAMGVSRKVGALPKDFELGETLILLAHRHGVVGDSDQKRFQESWAALQDAIVNASVEDLDSLHGQLQALREAMATPSWRKAIIAAFVPTAVETVITREEAVRGELKRRKKTWTLKALRASGITPVIVERAEEAPNA